MITSPLLVLTHEYPPRHGGIATYVAEAVETAKNQGAQVRVLAPRYTRAHKEAGLCITPTSVRGTLGWIDRLRLWRAVRRLKIDWAQTTLWLPEPGPIGLWMHGDLLPLPRPNKLVLTLHGSEILRFRRPGARLRRFQALLEKADRIGVVSSAVNDLLQEAAPAAGIRIRQAPGAVGRVLQAAIDSTRRAHSGKAFRLLTVGRLHPRKGQLDVVKALALLPAALRAKIDYQLIGPVRRPSYLAGIQDLARQNGISLRGPTELPRARDLAEAYVNADAMVLASREEALSIEGLGLVYLEAAAAGCPVIATAAGGAGEAVGPDNGLVVPAGDPRALAQAIADLINDPNRRAACADAGPAWARRFSWERVVEQHFGDA